jgi:hypothetical protein
MKIVHWIVAVCLFTSSCDTILNFDLGGSLRFCQILMIFVCLAGLASAIQNGTILWPRGSTSLMVWMLIQALLIPLSGVVSISIEFYLLLLFLVCGIFAFVQLYGDSDRVESLVRIYMLSYVVIAIYGLIQFVVPLLGLTAVENVIERQWIVHGKIARINGFSFEPSYFATYLVMGWIMLVELRVSKAKIASGRLWMYATVTVSAALFLSTSKTAWLIMGVELVARFFPFLLQSVRGFFREWNDGRLIIRVPRRRSIKYVVLGCVVALAGAAVLSRYIIDPAIFLSGTGLGKQPAHSLNDRAGAARETIDAFKEHPFVGRSLGGVSVYIASRNGVQVTSLAQAHLFWGFPVLMDVLVASGIWGFIPFLVFLYANTFGALRLATRHWPEERAKWLRALARAMIFEWIVLMTDQNLLRVYIWFHISMVAVVAYNLEFGFVPASLREPVRSRMPEFGEVVPSV